MDKMNEMKMKDCLNCAVGQEAIRRYCSIAHYTYEEIVNNEENLSDLKQLMSIMGIYDCFRKEETWEVASKRLCEKKRIFREDSRRRK